MLENMEVDHCLALAEMGAQLESISQEPITGGVEVPPELLIEAQIAENVAVGIEYPKSLGEKSLLSCPDCGGGLWEITENKLHRYRCHVGHAYSEQDLSLKQAESMEATLWIAMRMMEERRILLNKMTAQYRQKGLARLSTNYEEKVAQLKMHIDRLKEMLFAVQNTEHG